MWESLRTCARVLAAAFVLAVVLVSNVAHADDPAMAKPHRKPPSNGSNAGTFNPNEVGGD